MQTEICRAVARPIAAAFAAALCAASPAFADEPREETGHPLEEHETFYVQGFPAEPSEAWVIAIGGRVYDN